MEAAVLEVPETIVKKRTDEIVPKEEKSLWDYVMENSNKPPQYTINEEDADLIFGSNMWVKLMQEEVLDKE